MKNPKSIRSLFTFPGFTVGDMFCDRCAHVTQLKRRKNISAVCAVDIGAGDVTIKRICKYVLARFLGDESIWSSNAAVSVLSRCENLDLDGKRTLKKPFQANRCLNTAYVLKESFGQLWDYCTEHVVSSFFEHWKDSLKLYRKFPELIESLRDSIVAYFNLENKISHRLVEGVNNKIRISRRWTYDYRDEDSPKFKIVAAFLLPPPRNSNIKPHIFTWALKK